MTMKGKAIDVVINELDKLAMCKRGTLETEYSSRGARLNRITNNHTGLKPEFTKVERNRIYTKNRKRLLAILKFRKTKDMTHTSTSGRNLFTPESTKLYDEERKKLFMHPDLDKWAEKLVKCRHNRTTLDQEMGQRMAMLDHEFKQAKMNFISEQVSLKDFPRIFDELEVMVW